MYLIQNQLVFKRVIFLADLFKLQLNGLLVALVLRLNSLWAGTRYSIWEVYRLFEWGLLGKFGDWPHPKMMYLLWLLVYQGLQLFILFNLFFQILLIKLFLVDFFLVLFLRYAMVHHLGKVWSNRLWIIALGARVPFHFGHFLRNDGRTLHRWRMLLVRKYLILEVIDLALEWI